MNNKPWKKQVVAVTLEILLAAIYTVYGGYIILFGLITLPAVLDLCEKFIVLYQTTNVPLVFAVRVFPLMYLLFCLTMGGWVWLQIIRAGFTKSTNPVATDERP